MEREVRGLSLMGWLKELFVVKFVFSYSRFSNSRGNSSKKNGNDFIFPTCTEYPLVQLDLLMFELVGPLRG